MNTDNISLLGLTIDYGPYAFMDLFDANQICNHSDGEGRYTYAKQPSMGAYALQHLTISLSPLIGFEKEHGRAPYPFELLRTPSEQLEKWSEAGAQLVKDVGQLYINTFDVALRRGWLRRLGLRKPSPEHENVQTELIDPLLSVLHDLDFRITLRNWCRFPSIALSLADVSEKAQQEFVGDGKFFSLSRLQDWERTPKIEAATRWLQTYTRYLQEEDRDAQQIVEEMRQVSPLSEAIARTVLTRACLHRRPIRHSCCATGSPTKWSTD